MQTRSQKIIREVKDFFFTLPWRKSLHDNNSLRHQSLKFESNKAETWVLCFLIQVVFSQGTGRRGDTLFLFVRSFIT